MADHEDQPYRPNQRTSQEIWLGILVLGLFTLGGLLFSIKRLEASPSRWITDFLAQLALREVEINSTLSLSEEKGDFTVTGDAVAARLICDKGTVQDLEFQDISPVPGELTDLLVQKRFLCWNWSGYFLMDLDVDISEEGTTGTWQIVGGVRDYENLAGSGTFEGIYLEDGDTIQDTFIGEVEIKK